ncbi:MAG: HAD-IC family P-type ATPase, partial [Oscillospiraceae bacterium]
MKKTLIRILISAALFVGGLIVEHKFAEISLILLLASFLLAGGDVILNAFKNILRGKVFDENFLMSLATLGAIAIKQYPEAAAVMLFYQVGELFQSYAVDKSRKSIGELMDIRPDYANRKIGASIEKVDPEAIAIGDIIIVRAGEKIPLDGIVEDGSSMLDTSALTGESMPRKTEAGMEVLSGSINLNGLLTIRVTKKFSESTVSKILDLVENASNKKADSENFISKFAAVYTPVVVISAVLLAFVPPLIIEGAIFTDWLYRALTFLVVSCPCALVISIPLSFFGGIGGASRAGILVKGSNYLEAISKAEIVVFDKTGTLTEGVFAVREIFAANGNKDELLEFAAFAENQSNHPISLSLKKAYGKSIDNSMVTDINEISGYGVSAVVMGKNVIAGNSKLMARENIAF